MAFELGNSLKAVLNEWRANLIFFFNLEKVENKMRGQQRIKPQIGPTIKK